MGVQSDSWTTSPTDVGHRSQHDWCGGKWSFKHRGLKASKALHASTIMESSADMFPKTFSCLGYAMPFITRALLDQTMYPSSPAAFFFLCLPTICLKESQEQGLKAIELYLSSLSTFSVIFWPAEPLCFQQYFCLLVRSIYSCLSGLILVKNTREIKE